MPAMSSCDLHWKGLLAAHGVKTRNQKRLNAVARVVAANKFRDVAHLRSAPPPAQWLCSERLYTDEVAALEELCTQQRRRQEAMKRPAPEAGVTRAVDAAAAADAPPVKEPVAVGGGVLGDKEARTAMAPAGGGPRKVLRTLKVSLDNEKDRQTWMHRARTSAILGAAPKTLDKMASGLRCWIEFHEQLAGSEWGPVFPPSLGALLAFSCIFSCRGTWTHYVGHLRTACLLGGCPTVVFDDPALRRAGLAIDKRFPSVPREKRFVRFGHIQEMAALAESVPRWRIPFLVFLSAYTFMLRVPSECLPVAVHSCGEFPADTTPVLHVPEDSVSWYLPRRKTGHVHR